MKALTEMNKAELRAACKEHGVTGYGNMDNATMRNAIESAKTDAKNIAQTGHKDCPHCKTSLENGYWPVDELIDTQYNDGNRKAAEQTNLEAKFEFYCSCCGDYFGPTRVPTVPKAKAEPVATGIKIEKNRDEQNGIKRPSVGGVCRKIWDAADEFNATNKRIPKLKEIKAIATDKGWDLVTTSIQYYTWRKFMGIEGRV